MGQAQSELDIPKPLIPHVGEVHDSRGLRESQRKLTEEEIEAQRYKPFETGKLITHLED